MCSRYYFMSLISTLSVPFERLPEPDIYSPDYVKISKVFLVIHILWLTNGQYYFDIPLSLRLLRTSLIHFQDLDVLFNPLCQDTSAQVHAAVNLREGSFRSTRGWALRESGLFQDSCTSKHSNR